MANTQPIFTLETVDQHTRLVLEQGRIIGAVWSSPPPYKGWYWGRARVTFNDIDLEACGVQQSEGGAFNACIKPENRKYLEMRSK